MDLHLHLHEAIIEFLKKPEYADISTKFDLSSAEWDALQAFSDILQVCSHQPLHTVGNNLQIPHAFQQILSGEKTPTLGVALPAFEAMAMKWKQHQDANPKFTNVIDTRLEKLDEYFMYTQQVPANIIVVGNTLCGPLLTFTDYILWTSAESRCKIALVSHTYTKKSGSGWTVSSKQGNNSNLFVLVYCILTTFLAQTIS